LPVCDCKFRVLMLVKQVFGESGAGG